MQATAKSSHPLFCTVVYSLKDGLPTDQLKIDIQPESVVDRHAIVASSGSNELLRLEYIERIAEGGLLSSCDAYEKLQAIREIVALSASNTSKSHIDKLVAGYQE